MNYIIINIFGKITHSGYTSDINFKIPDKIKNSKLIKNVEANVKTDYYCLKENKVKLLPPKPNNISVFNYESKKWETDESKLITENRKNNYPSIADQLDMLYHAMKNGEIPIATNWVSAIEEVKNKYPKVTNNG